MTMEEEGGCCSSIGQIVISSPIGVWGMECTYLPSVRGGEVEVGLGSWEKGWEVGRRVGKSEL